jgi:hypothetical protein
VAEAQAGQGAETQPAPAGTESVAIEPGDTISGLMAQAEPPLDWTDPADRKQFLLDNPQFITYEDAQADPDLAALFDPGSGRNPDLIWPGEVVYIRSGSAPDVGGPPPTNGTQAVSGPDAEGNYVYQNYVNGQPTGSQYTARPGMGGQPANSVIIGDNGGEIRTDAQGAPLTGWGQVGETAQSGESAYVYYVNGMPTTQSQVRGMTEGPPTEPPPPATGEDAAGSSYATTGWHITASSSQGVAQHYFVNGYQIDSDQVINGRVDGPPPIIPPGTNAALAEKAATAESGTQAGEQANTYPDGTRDTVNASGQTVRVDAAGSPVNGVYWTGGDSRGNASYAVYENGVRTERSWTVASGDGGYTNEPGAQLQRPAGNPAGTGPYDTTMVQGATDQAASNYYNQGHPPYSADVIDAARQQFIDAVRTELASGESTVQDIRGRYGNDPWMNAVIEEAAFGPRT